MSTSTNQNSNHWLEKSVGPRICSSQLDQHHRLEGENPPIGIVICRSKTKTVVECALRNMNRPLGIATYTVTPQLPANFAGDLPSPEEIATRLQAWGKLDGCEDE